MSDPLIPPHDCSPSGGKSPALDVFAHLMNSGALDDLSGDVSAFVVNKDGSVGRLNEVSAEFQKASPADLDHVSGRIKQHLFDHPGFPGHERLIAELATYDGRAWGWDTGPITPRIGTIEPHNVASDLFARFIHTGLSISERLDDLVSWVGGVGPTLDYQLDVLFEILDGTRPVVFLTAGQQEALWHTDAEHDWRAPSIFPAGPVVILPEPIEYGSMMVRGLIVRLPSEMRFEADTPQSNAIIDVLCDMGISVPDKPAGWVRTWITHLSLDRTDPEGAFSPDAADARDRFIGFMDAVLAAVEMFGVVDDTPPPLPMSRAERRRHQRTVEKATPKAESHLSIRYLRDPRRKLAAVHKSEPTGRHVKPHWRRGHIRWVRSGSMTLPREERPTIRHLIPPVIVNAHLGKPSGVVAYRCKDATDA